MCACVYDTNIRAYIHMKHRRSCNHSHLLRVARIPLVVKTLVVKTLVETSDYLKHGEQTRFEVMEVGRRTQPEIMRPKYGVD